MNTRQFEGGAAGKALAATLPRVVEELEGVEVLRMGYFMDECPQRLHDNAVAP